MKRHIDHVHRRIKNYQCDKCDARYQFKGKLLYWTNHKIQCPKSKHAIFKNLTNFLGLILTWTLIFLCGKNYYKKSIFCNVEFQNCQNIDFSQIQEIEFSIYVQILFLTKNQGLKLSIFCKFDMAQFSILRLFKGQNCANFHFSPIQTEICLLNFRTIHSVV